MNYIRQLDQNLNLIVNPHLKNQMNYLMMRMIVMKGSLLLKKRLNKKERERVKLKNNLMVDYLNKLIQIKLVLKENKYFKKVKKN